jgi:hypothetical protein
MVRGRLLKCNLGGQNTSSPSEVPVSSLANEAAEENGLNGTVLAGDVGVVKLVADGIR